MCAAGCKQQSDQIFEPGFHDTSLSRSDMEPGQNFVLIDGIDRISQGFLKDNIEKTASHP
jgi:hypothetical protein